MTKYNKFDRQEFKRPGIHPIWRGIGLLMMMIVPIISWIAAEELTRMGFEQGWPFMYGMGGFLTLPAIFYAIPLIGDFSAWVSSIPDLPAKLAFFVLFMIFFFGVLSFVYAWVYRVVGPPRLLPTDAPPPDRKPKKYSR